MTASQKDNEDGGTPDLEVVLDLLEEDQQLREAIGKPTPIRLPTGEIVTIPHGSDWDHRASRLMVVDAWDAWAQLLLSEDDYKKWSEAELHIYQINRIVEVLNSAHGITAGKPSPSSSSRGSKGRR